MILHAPLVDASVAPDDVPPDYLSDACSCGALEEWRGRIKSGRAQTKRRPLKVVPNQSATRHSLKLSHRRADRRAPWRVGAHPCAFTSVGPLHMPPTSNMRSDPSMSD